MASLAANKLKARLAAKRHKAGADEPAEPIAQASSAEASTPVIQIHRGKLGLGAQAEPAPSQATKAVAKGLHRAKRRQRRDEAEEEEDDVTQTTIDEESKLATVTKAQPKLDVVDQLREQQAEKTAKRRKKRQARNNKEAETTSTPAPAGPNPFSDPTFDADAEQDAFATNWQSDWRDEAMQETADAPAQPSPTTTAPAAPAPKEKAKAAKDETADTTAADAKKPKRKRPKKRSKQKNLRKDNRPAHLVRAVALLLPIDFHMLEETKTACAWIKGSH
ncbi:uncharacterized protein MONBRDRAFT_6195 [Monosiga brevicollis MX1]|uniref:Uncharacterized protein n=1 Tax=Monosiga brevicollis TaxID=81824 RepID=A9UT41_MONBE|nr:uncharacterized protein MONBRDRAFT_6195 [Monosiga brevicollis MX1]EDQ91178.1 predicted protein [Monosiga brevicollis MX1]|eukprot:XP_001743600.1 hypothetical protein [Monosiga brevicollis MX1]